MIYKAKITGLDICSCDHEGNIEFEIEGTKFSAYFQTGKEFMHDYLVKDSGCIALDSDGYKFDFTNIDKYVDIEIDIWFGYMNKIDEKRKVLSLTNKGNIELVEGEVTEINEDGDFKVDCGRFIFYVQNEEDIGDLRIGDYISTRGEFKVSFPNTHYDR